MSAPVPHPRIASSRLIGDDPDDVLPSVAEVCWQVAGAIVVVALLLSR